MVFVKEVYGVDMKVIYVFFKLKFDGIFIDMWLYVGICLVDVGLWGRK